MQISEENTCASPQSTIRSLNTSEAHYSIIQSCILNRIGFCQHYLCQPDIKNTICFFYKKRSFYDYFIKKSCPVWTKIVRKTTRTTRAVRLILGTEQHRLLPHSNQCLLFCRKVSFLANSRQLLFLVPATVPFGLVQKKARRSSRQRRLRYTTENHTNRAP